jgi:hypothetical protein
MTILGSVSVETILAEVGNLGAAQEARAKQKIH